MKPEHAAALTIDRFESGAIDPAVFDHEAHIYVAWLYVQRFGAAALAIHDENLVNELFTVCCHVAILVSEAIRAVHFFSASGPPDQSARAGVGF